MNAPKAVYEIEFVDFDGTEKPAYMMDDGTISFGRKIDMEVNGMDLEKKLEIVDNYVKDIKQYLHYGLEEGRANSSEGEDLMEHFKIMAESFKQVVRLEDKLGVDLDTLNKICKQRFIYVKNISGEIHPRELSYVDIYTRKIRFIIQYQPDTVFTTREFKDYGKTWALTEEELL